MRSDDEKRTIKELGFGKWFTDVLWYHYKWLILGAAAVALAALTLVLMSRGRVKNDAMVILAVSTDVSEEARYGLQSAVASVVGDLNGDGQISVNIVFIPLNNPSQQAQASSWQTQFVTSFMNPEAVLYLMDGKNMRAYTKGEGAEMFSAVEAAKFGAEGLAVPLGESALLAELGFADGTALYALFKEKPYDEDQPDAMYYTVAEKIADGLLNGEYAVYE